MERWKAYCELKAAGLALATDYSVAARERLTRAWAAFLPLELKWMYPAVRVNYDALPLLIPARG
jgi:hypothetical protein